MTGPPLRPYTKYFKISELQGIPFLLTSFTLPTQKPLIVSHSQSPSLSNTVNPAAWAVGEGGGRSTSWVEDGPQRKKNSSITETEQHNSSDFDLEKSVSHDFPHLGKINTFNDQVRNLLRVFCLHVGNSTATLCYKNTPDTYAQNVRIRNDAHHT